MALTISRIDRRPRSYDLSDLFGGVESVPGDVTGVEVALLPKRSGPTAATVWTSVTYASGSFDVLWVGPDADSAGGFVVPASADAWMKITDAPLVEAVKIERITVLGGGSLAGLPNVHVASVNGRSGTVTLDAEDVDAAHADPVLSGFDYDETTNDLLSYQEDGITITLTYNADGTVATSKRGSAATKTYSYSGGNLTGVA